MSLEHAVENKFGSHQHNDNIKAMSLDEITQGEKVDTEEGNSTSWKAQTLTGFIHIYSPST